MSALQQDLSVEQRMRSYIQRVATGPELGKSISMEEAEDAMTSILADQIDPVQSAIYLIALRMKRETDAEFAGSLLGFRQSVMQAQVDVPDLVDIADPFDGFARCVPASTFLPAVLAALDIACLLQGANSIGPKYGVTHRKILLASGLNVELSSQQAAKQIENVALRWAYLDQRHSCPDLHALLPLRERMVKRSVLTTIETLSMPLQGHKTHMMGGFVHRAYPPVYALLAQQAGFNSAMIVKGVEGGVLPSVSQVARYFRYDEDTNELGQVRLDPNELNIIQAERAVPLPADLPKPINTPNSIAVSVNSDGLAAVAAKMGLAALQGEQGITYDSLVYGASICLCHVGKAKSLPNAAILARQVIDSGDAHKHFKAALL